jgi:hypothetical protein
VQPRAGLPPFARLGNGLIILPALLAAALAVYRGRRRSGERAAAPAGT